MQPSTLQSLRKKVAAAVAAQASQVRTLALDIHGFAEPPLGEVRSSRAIADYLAAQGLQVSFPFKQLPTALRAEWGTKGPVIGFLGEYDALPDCGGGEGEWGHGCGHNLLGTAPAAAAAAVKMLLEQSGRPGRIVYYGCPAEETLIGKVYMARDGAFRELDACLGWHPSTKTEVDNVGGAAMDSLVFEFFGRTSHAGASPHRGRSALDGVVLTDVAANYLREHVEENVRIHSVIVHGGDAPNVVPAYAKSWYFVRGKDRCQVDEVRERLLACARGAAEATGTTMQWQRLTAVYNRLPNDALSAVAERNLRHFGAPKPTAADRKLVRDQLGLEPDYAWQYAGWKKDAGRASTDEANVSWIAPFARFNLTCYASGTPAHHRHTAAQAAMPYAGRALLQSAKIFAGSAMELWNAPGILASAKREFRKRTAGKPYAPLIPKSRKPPNSPISHHLPF